VIAMAEYTDLACHSPEIAEAVRDYLAEQLAQQEEPPNITAYVAGSTLRLTYADDIDRHEWDMQLMGFRDGYEAASAVPTKE